MAESTRTTVLQLKITLLDIKPDIWRRIQIPGTKTFGDLHYAIQDSFWWLNHHLHQYCIERLKVISDIEFDIDQYGDIEVIDEEMFKLKDFFHEPGDSIVYEYDFGDDWRHEIVLECKVPREKGKRYPCCLDGQRATPPEDVGGTMSYERFLEAISDPKDEEHEFTKEWYLGTTAQYRDSKPFDPERFDLTEVNRWMRKQYTRKETEKNR